MFDHVTVLAPEPLARPDELDDLELGIIKDARRRQRARRKRLAIVVSAGVLVLALGLMGLRGGGEHHPARPVPALLAGSKLERPDALLSRLPFMAVTCHTPNSIACDRVGLAVWLRHPALSISATIAGAPLQLNNPHRSGPARHGRRWMFAGFLHPAEIGTRLNLTNDPNSTTWLPPSNVPLGPDTSSYTPEPVVQLRIQVAPGRTVATQLHVPLGEGWG